MKAAASDNPSRPSGVPGDELRRHIATVCRKWKRTWDNTSTLPTGMIDDIVAAADAYALAYARDCIAAIGRARNGDPAELGRLVEQLAVTAPARKEDHQVSVRYWVLAADELMISNPPWPEGLRVVAPEQHDRRPESDQPGMRWWLFEDDGAPATLEGKQVELTFTRCADKIQIGSRRPAI